MQNYQSYVSQRGWLPLLLVLLVATAVACGGGEAPAPEGEMESAASDPAPAATPRVFFVAPQDGQMISVDNPVVFEFGWRTTSSPRYRKRSSSRGPVWGTITWGRHRVSPGWRGDSSVRSLGALR